MLIHQTNYCSKGYSWTLLVPLLLLLPISSLCCSSPRATQDPIYAPPQTAKTVEDIHFDLQVQTRDGQLEFLHPQKRRFRFRESDYLVAIDNDVIRAGGESYVHAWLYIYNKSFKEWRCFQVTHFRNVSRIDSAFDEAKGQIVIKCIGNETLNGEVLTIFNLEATSDDAAYVR